MMNLAINIENADDSVLKALKSVLDMRPELNFKIKKQELSENGYIKEFEEELLLDIKEFEKSDKEGKVKTFKSVDEMFVDLES